MTHSEGGVGDGIRRCPGRGCHPSTRPSRWSAALIRALPVGRSQPEPRSTPPVRKQHRKFRLGTDFDDNDTYLDDAYADYAMVTRTNVRRGDGEAAPDRRGRLTEAERDRLALLREEDSSAAHAPTVGDRWSTWERAEHGPDPRPDWVITELVAEDTELGVLKTGKEADVHLITRE